jgi:hypothetical protein
MFGSVPGPKLKVSNPFARRSKFGNAFTAAPRLNECPYDHLGEGLRLEKSRARSSSVA